MVSIPIELWWTHILYRKWWFMSFYFCHAFVSDFILLFINISVLSGCLCSFTSLRITFLFQWRYLEMRNRLFPMFDRMPTNPCWENEFQSSMSFINQILWAICLSLLIWTWFVSSFCLWNQMEVTVILEHIFTTVAPFQLFFLFYKTFS